MKKCLWALLGFAFLISSCSINKNIMFRNDQDYVFDVPVLDAALSDPSNIDSLNIGYKIAPFDIMTFQLFTNSGAMILDYSTSTVDRQPFYAGFNLQYLIDSEGYVELPAIGRYKIAGLTVLQAQNYLEKLFSQQFNAPFCQIQIINRRAIVFTGEGSQGTVVPLLNQSISVIEVIALAGGVRDRGNASKVKLIRKVDGKNQIYRMDLSKIEGIQFAKMIVQTGDIIYVEPVPQLATEFVKDIAPIVSMLSSAILLYLVISR